MQKTHLLAAGTALLALAACNSEPETINDFDSQSAELQNAAPVELPPAITASRTYRCSDNSLVYVDFYNNNTAALRNRQEDAPTMLTAEGGNPPFVAPGHSVSGTGENVRITAPGKNNLACHT
jgi:hypothetical protein